MTTIQEEPFDIIVMADVLEHFQDLSVPLSCLTRLLHKSEGRLFVSLPTENWLYVLGRLVVRKEKPEDHYHSARTVIEFLKRNDLEVLERAYAPHFCGISVPLFTVAALRFRARNHYSAGGVV